MTIDEIAVKVADAACFECEDARERDAVMTYLCVLKAGLPVDASALASLSRCFMCLDRTQAMSVELYLLCIIVATFPTCDPAIIEAEAPCVDCLDRKQQDALYALLLCEWNGGTPTPPSESNYEATDQGVRVTTDDGSNIVLNV